MVLSGTDHVGPLSFKDALGVCPADALTPDPGCIRDVRS
jgi:hypothetical protein